MKFKKIGDKLNLFKKRKSRRFLKNIFKLFFFLYLFVLSIEVIRKSSLALAPNIKDFILQSLTPLKAISVGWFTTSIVQSSGAVASVTAAFVGNNLLSLNLAVYVLMGAFIGTSITALIISFITASKKRRDFRHGFEIGLCYAIYSLFLVIIVFALEYLFKSFSKLSFFLASLIQGRISILNIPDIMNMITSPITKPLFEGNHKLILFFLGFLILIFTLRYISKSVIAVLGGEKNARKFINRFFESKYKAYLIGVLLTAIVFSSSITIGLLVPLAVARLINLKKAIPFIIGANLGTFTDVFLASIIIGKIPALATAMIYISFSLLGSIIFLPNTNLLFRMTKYTSKRLIHISRKKALYFLIAFILIPLFVVIVL